MEATQGAVGQELLSDSDFPGATSMCSWTHQATLSGRHDMRRSTAARYASTCRLSSRQTLWGLAPTGDCAACDEVKADWHVRHLLVHMAQCTRCSARKHAAALVARLARGDLGQALQWPWRWGARGDGRNIRDVRLGLILQVASLLE
jgi:hypothetical protein